MEHFKKEHFVEFPIYIHKYLYIQNVPSKKGHVSPSSFFIIQLLAISYMLTFHAPLTKSKPLKIYGHPLYIFIYISLICLLIRCRFGFFHVVNNHYSRWLMYAVGGSSHPTIYSQGNRFKAPNLVNCKEVGHTFTLKHYKASPFMMWMARITPLPDGSDP